MKTDVFLADEPVCDKVKTQPVGIVSELLTLQQAADMCGVGVRTLQRWVKSGKAPGPIKFGTSKQSATRYRRSDYLRWIEGGCQAINGGND